MIKKFAFVLTVFFWTFLFAGTVQAKVLPQAVKQVKPTSSVTNKAVSAGIGVSLRLRSDRRALVAYFSNLQNASLVSYLLTYQTSTQEEGAMGGVNVNATPSLTQELLFGTCSKGVCRYHTGVHDVRFEVSYTTISGKKYLRKYKVNI